MFDGSDAAILEEILRGPKSALVRPPDSRLIERPGWFQLITPSFRQGGLNEVSHAVLDSAEADAVIDVTIAEYRSLGIKFRWEVTPGSMPEDLGERLERRGLVKRWVRGMFRLISSASSARPSTSSARPEDPRASSGATVEEVRGSTLDVYTRVMATGWNVEEGPLDKFHRQIFGQVDRKQHFFLARHHGRAVGVASYVALENSAYLLGAVVLPEFRGRGLYRSLVEARVDHARARGIALATSQANERTSAPILEGLGFRTACRFAVYEG